MKQGRFMIKKCSSPTGDGNGWTVHVDCDTEYY